MKSLIYFSLISMLFINSTAASVPTFQNMKAAVSAAYGEFGIEEPSEDYWRKGCEDDQFCFIQSEKFMLYANSHKIIITSKTLETELLENSCMVAYENMTALPQYISSSAIVYAFNIKNMGKPYVKGGYSIVVKRVSAESPFIECTIEVHK